MCGIAGSFNKERAFELYKSNLNRGYYSSGAIITAKNRYHLLFKRSGCFDEPVQWQSPTDNFPDNCYYLYHSRGPTVETKSYEGRIYINSIKLGPKAEKRRTGDAKNYAEATGGDQSFDYKQWSGLIKDIPGAGANFKVVISPVGTLDVEQKTVFKEIQTLVSQNALVRPSKKGGPSKTKFVVIWGNNNIFVAEVGNAAEKLKNPNIPIRIGKKAGNSDAFDKSFDAKIQLIPAS
jgi:hypothetical protein